MPSTPTWKNAPSTYLTGDELTPQLDCDALVKGEKGSTLNGIVSLAGIPSEERKAEINELLDDFGRENPTWRFRQRNHAAWVAFLEAHHDDLVEAVEKEEIRLLEQQATQQEEENKPQSNFQPPERDGDGRSGASMTSESSSQESDSGGNPGPFSKMQPERGENERLEVDGEVFLLDDIRWAYLHMSRGNLKPSQAPTLGAYGLWEMAREDKWKFVTQLVVKALPNAKEQEGQANEKQDHEAKLAMIHDVQGIIGEILEGISGA